MGFSEEVRICMYVCVRTMKHYPRYYQRFYFSFFDDYKTGLHRRVSEARNFRTRPAGRYSGT